MTTKIEGAEQAQTDDLRQLETPADNTEPVIESREREPERVEAAEEKKPEIQYGTPADRKRNAINDRFQRQQDENGAKVERSDETERMMGGSNLQTRADREAAEAAANVQDASHITPADVPPPRRIRLKVNGEERELDEEQVNGYAQIALASQDILNDAKRDRAAAQAELAELRQLRADQSRRQTEQPAPAQIPAEDTKPAKTDEELDEIIEAIQTGDPTDAKRALNKYGDQIERRMMEKIGNIDERIAATTQRLNDTARVNNEANTAIAAFAQENADFASRPLMVKALADEMVEVMRETLRELNVKDETISHIAKTQGIAPQAAIGRAMNELRRRGYELPNHREVIDRAAMRVRDGFGIPAPAARQEAPAPAVNQTPSILADREARKAAMAPQPRRANVSPGPDLTPAKSKEELARDHVRQMKVSRRRY